MAGLVLGTDLNDQLVQLAALVAPGGNGLVRLVTREGIGRLGKSILRSRTVWWNLVLIIAAGFAAYSGEWKAALLLGAFAAANLFLRKVTTRGLTLFPHPSRRA